MSSLLKTLTLIIIGAASLTSSAKSPFPAGTFDRLDAGITVGTTGLGIDLSSPIGNYVRMRAGIEFTPRFNVPLHFGMESFKEGTLETTDFSKLQEFMHKVTGYEVDDRIDIHGQPRMFNAHVLFDFMPLADKRWHLTAGFYVGSKEVARAINTIQEMPSLLAIGVYNRAYEYFTTTDFFDTPIYNDVYLDPDMAEQVKEKFEEYGEVAIHVGDFRDTGKPYMMLPDTDGLVKAKMLVNRFRPYVGAGYYGALPRNNRVNLGFDLGMMMWGGTPSIITHEGVNLSKDVTDIGGRVGDYVRTAKAFKVYPVLNFKITYTLF